MAYATSSTVSPISFLPAVYSYVFFHLFPNGFLPIQRLLSSLGGSRGRGWRGGWLNKTMYNFPLPLIIIFGDLDWVVSGSWPLQSEEAVLFKIFPNTAEAA